MNVRILESARQDLREGYTFYERQQAGVGEYFLDSLFAEIDSLALYGGVHALRLGFHRMLSDKFPYACTTSSRREMWLCMPFSTVAAIRRGLRSG
jgi:plasmid stabilization system protein ParE